MIRSVPVRRNEKRSTPMSAPSMLFLSQNSPVIFPVFSSTSIRSAAGDFGRPGMVMISPVRATRKPAPAETFRFRTVTVKPSGAPSRAGSSEKEYCVLATHTGILSKPRAVSFSACFFAAGGQHHAGAAVDLLCDGFQLLLDGGVQLIGANTPLLRASIQRAGLALYLKSLTSFAN